ncbi:carbon monoxide dehydrogenase subunit G [Roseomonas sp. 18066]|uniref:SRPBCC family protein n=1 Tax=Roseomonas sp. 18066 TaxID=2681412 RepID=UPI00135C58F0|nr:carbon monoxide dehydrogenase subunit G [Roseomonas sp. 18066]
MEMTGERRIEAPRQTVWEGLNDPEVLRASIPGCESVDRTAEDAFQARVGLKIGPMAAKFTGKVQLSNINAPAGYTISGEGNGGAMGFAKGGADVALEEDGPSATILKYQVKAQVGGKMAQLGARLIDSTAKQMADQFFDRFAATVAVPVAAAPVAAAPIAAAGSDLAPATPVMATPVMATPVAAPPPPVRAPLPAAAPISILALVPSELFGLPLLFWGGSAIFMVVLFLLFVLG